MILFLLFLFPSLHLSKDWPFLPLFFWVPETQGLWEFSRSFLKLRIRSHC